MSAEKKEILQRIARHLMLHSSFANDCGLYHGKMGAIIFFFRYARYTGNPVYEDFAGELIEEIYDEIHTGMADTFETGLCGVAWGLEYLLHQGFVEGDSNEVLEDLDKRILERDVRRIGNPELESGLKGLAHYVLIRYYNKDSVPALLDQIYLSEIISGLEKLETDDQEIPKITSSIKSILNGDDYNYDVEELLLGIIGDIEYDEKKLFENPQPIGLKRNGYAGIGIKLMAEEKPE